MLVTCDTRFDISFDLLYSSRSDSHSHSHSWSQFIWFEKRTDRIIDESYTVFQMATKWHRLLQVLVGNSMGRLMDFFALLRFESCKNRFQLFSQMYDNDMFSPSSKEMIAFDFAHALSFSLSHSIAFVVHNVHVFLFNRQKQNQDIQAYEIVQINPETLPHKRTQAAIGYHFNL